MNHQEYQHIMEIIRNLIDRIMKSLDGVQVRVQNPEALRAYLADISRLVWKLLGHIDELACMSCSAEKREGRERDDSRFELVADAILTNIEISESLSLIWIEMDGRLPSRKAMSQRRASSGAGCTYLMDAVAKGALDGHPGFRIESKAELLFYFEYASNIVARDVDNVNVKPLIDALCRTCNMDDSITDLRLTLDGAVTGRDHVTIVLAPVDVFDVRREDIMRRLKKGGKSDGQEEG